ncbi:hypothetical protein CI109_101570 [Kwoniella shandongensis]|uniref:Uncharacterized protein n=1 Tax=Kwoniella shandongensis TaxID=1734106 RepID=A0A5M6C5V3_9TREE|nr:uncharacterized protein CI109_001298 [Kwoniella shandongensis]KAA5530494.1 hypothetical protein CI109_001298 [Kwoniella shandongensis]
MATRTRTSGRTTTMAPSRTQIQPGTPVSGDNEVKCTGHQLKCPKLRAGPTTKNAGRSFYCCPLPRDDPSRCKFFKWHDELFPGSDSTITSPSVGGSTRAATLVNQTNQTLGQSPQARYGRPSTNTPTAVRIIPRAPPPDVDGEEEEQHQNYDSDGEELVEIDWGKVDTDEIEREAIASTPGSTQRTSTQGQVPTPSTGGRGTVSFSERLRGAVEDGLGKRKLSEEEDDDGILERTPKRANAEPNPFLSSPSVHSPPHAIVSPALSSLESISEHLHRQDRLIRAAEQMKKGMRLTIKGLQDKNKELEERVKELEKRLGQ